MAPVVDLAEEERIADFFKGKTPKVSSNCSLLNSIEYGSRPYHSYGLTFVSTSNVLLKINGPSILG